MMKFVAEHANDDVNALRLKYCGKSKFKDFDFQFALLQIEMRRKYRKKISSFLKNPNFLFPDSLAPEQASNEIVARFHSSLLGACHSLLDLTAGLGIDDLTFAMHGIRVTSCEINENKAKILQHNAESIGVSDKLTVICCDSIEFLRYNNEKFDVVFADPARRGISGARLHALADCQPDILTAMPLIMAASPRLLVKCSPLLDISLIRDSIDSLAHIYVVCVKGECKEILIDIQKDKMFSGVTVVDLALNKVISQFDCLLSPSDSSDFSNSVRFAVRESPAEYKYLYEPNAGVMKTFAWTELGMQFPDLEKADPNTHIFFSDTLYPDFPGRILNVVCLLDKKALKSLKGSKFNVVARNYPISAPDIERKYALKPGDSDFIYAFRYKSTPTLLQGML